MTKRKTVGSFDRIREERALADEIFIQAGADAYRRNIMHVLQGLTRAQVLDWYYTEYPEMLRHVERHIEAGTCKEFLLELQSEIAKTYPQKPHEPRDPADRIYLAGDQCFGFPDYDSKAFECMDEFRAEPRVIPSRPRAIQIEWSPKERPRGREPVIFNRVVREMQGYDDQNDLKTMKVSRMATIFKASRDTVCRAHKLLFAK